MNTDWLLELLGIRPQNADAKTGPDGQYIQPNSERQAQRAEYMDRVNTPPPPPTSDLMQIVNRQHTNPTPNPRVDAVMAPAMEQNAQVGAGIQREQDQLAAMEAQMAAVERDQQARLADVRNQNARQRALTPEQFSGPAAPPTPAAANGRSMPAAPLRAPNPGNPGNPLAQPVNPAFAALERAGPPFVDASAPAPQPIPARPAPQAPVVPINQPAPAMPGQMPAAPLRDPGIINSGPFVTMDPGNPFAEYMPPNVAPANGNPPPPSDPRARLQPRSPIPPFTEPSAVMQLATGQREGMPIIGQPPTTPPAPPEAFAPDGQVINWWNTGQGPTPTAPQAAPSMAPRRAPPAAQGPGTSTLLNQQELQRFLTANGGNPIPPPTPATTPTPIVTSNPAPAPVPPAPGATPMTPAAPPSPGSQIPPALQEQLLQEAYRLIGQRNQQTLGAR